MKLFKFKEVSVVEDSYSSEFYIGLWANRVYKVPFIYFITGCSSYYLEMLSHIVKKGIYGQYNTLELKGRTIKTKECIKILFKENKETYWQR